MTSNGKDKENTKDKKLVVGDETHDNPREHQYELHNYTLRFDIISAPYEFNQGITRHMKNWSYKEIQDTDYTIRIMPHCILLFIRKRKITGNPMELEQTFIREAIGYMKRWSEQNNFRVSEPTIINNEVKILDYKVMENFRTANFKAVYPIPSQIEFTNPSHAVKDSVKFITHVDQIESLLLRFSYQLERHLDAVEKIGDGEQKLADKVEELTSVIKEIRKPTLLERIKRLFI
jgi:hypothetical protein